MITNSAQLFWGEGWSLPFEVEVLRVPVAQVLKTGIPVLGVDRENVEVPPIAADMVEKR